MANRREKKKTSTGFLAVVIAAMVVVFCAQMLFPTNLGKHYSKLAEDAVEVTVTTTQGEAESVSYHTEAQKDMLDFQAWATGQKMRNRSLADSIVADAKEVIQYNFAIRSSDGTYSSMVIDGKGYVHVGAELYQVTGSVDQFLSELEDQLAGWNRA